MNEQNVLVIGYGEMGHAMTHLLEPRHAVTVWQRHAESGTALPLAEAARERSFVIFCVPTEPVYSIAEAIRETLPPDAICLSIGKGLDSRGRPAFRALTDALGQQRPHAVIYGPMIAEELSADRPGFAQVGSSNARWSERTQQLFGNTRLYLTTSDDTTGLSWCAVLKNIYAIAFGVADGLGLGDNVRGLLAAQAMGELAEIAVELGGSRAAPYGLAGLGDLLTTATSANSHHHGLGLKIACGERSALSGEGIHTLTMVKQYGVIDIPRYPLFQLVVRLVESGGDIASLWQQYLDAAFPSHRP